MTSSNRKVFLALLLGLSILVPMGIYKINLIINEFKATRLQNLKAQQSQQAVSNITTNQNLPTKQSPAENDYYRVTDSPIDSSRSTDTPIAGEYDWQETVPYKDRPLIDCCRFFDRYSKISGSASAKLPRLFEVQVRMGPLLLQQRIPIFREVNEQIFKESVHIGDNEFSSLISNIDFVRKLYLVRSELMANLADARNVETRSYYIWVLAQIAAKSPILLADGTVKNICSMFENFDQSYSQEEMNNEIRSALYKAQISEDEIIWDPHFQSELKVEWDRDGFNYSGTPRKKIFKN